jgi:hypothetical protein
MNQLFLCFQRSQANDLSDRNVYGNDFPGNAFPAVQMRSPKIVFLFEAGMR